MEILSDLTGKGTYIIRELTCNRRLAKRLAEIGIKAGKSIEVISLSDHTAGLIIYFQGQRLAMSNEIASQIKVVPVNEIANDNYKTLADMAINQPGVVVKILGSKALRKRLMDMGLTKNTVVKIERVAPLGDPIELIVRGYKLSLRKSDAQAVVLTEI
ncbi:ferrous iron transporter A [Leuconostoc litchii]|uniref:Fatty-acid synthase n=1 Tax=Leuconostoc litchii TaxID=1981069 RepID=A0A6P2CNJ3_9LACO|nr:ferrous iron transport protein A [Leuconostoc litchii]TYC47618.1 fatty-acid synthase [Leuconostoc litchii]GMA69666.1 ferrous iron transporter A [Leuconostoc litchii]